MEICRAYSCRDVSVWTKVLDQWTDSQDLPPTVNRAVFKSMFLSACVCIGAVYICTEDSFPIRRLQQLIRQQSCLRSDVPPSLISSLPFSDHVYIEHAADLVSSYCWPQTRSETEAGGLFIGWVVIHILQVSLTCLSFCLTCLSKIQIRKSFDIKDQKPKLSKHYRKLLTLRDD